MLKAERRPTDKESLKLSHVVPAKFVIFIRQVALVCAEHYHGMASIDSKSGRLYCSTLASLRDPSDFGR